VYLAYLVARLQRAGGTLHTGRHFASIAAAGRELAAAVIVNCTGIGARELVPDPGVIPVRGQVIVVANPGLTGFFVGEGHGPDEVSYYFAHRSTVVLGGTHQRGNPATTPDPADADRIRRDCAAIEPRLADAPALAHLAGLRPVRDSVRLASSPGPDGRLLVHNYGHGGSGVTVSWGCAAEVTSMIGSRAASS
jgi:D-amino-acid oxidase